ncbi:winged helix-turn-helix transcriptional regulator [Microbacterium elymi]|uniref:Helix-turn-helix transcriptional regulator n=1 Tax=Microbacterium elymi TaxID=2909587 RepID=A0ABY5NM60_9MICO|nr:helix-turn-helix domain-containing protein [Microbacterium elymi]UUT36255.1 helix-turn-helix transcriptional regulator [Microbacterium elymi]
MAARSYGQYCGVTTAVDLIGERWALLIIRDLLVGPRRYTDLNQGLPRIPTNILSARLKELQDGGVVRRVPLAPLRPGVRADRVRPRARADRPRARPLGVPGDGRPRPRRPGHPGLADHGAAHRVPGGCRGLGAARGLRAARGRRRAAGPGLPRGLHVAQVAPPAPPVGGMPPAGDPDITIAAGPGIRHIISGELTPAAALDAGVLHVLAGDPVLLERFAATFHIDSGTVLVPERTADERTRA